MHSIHEIAHFVCQAGAMVIRLVVAQPEPVQESSDIAAAAPLIQINNSDEVVQMPNVAPELSVSPSETLSSPLSSRPSGSPDLDELIRKQRARQGAT